MFSIVNPDVEPDAPDAHPPHTAKTALEELCSRLMALSRQGPKYAGAARFATDLGVCHRQMQLHANNWSEAGIRGQLDTLDQKLQQIWITARSLPADAALGMKDTALYEAVREQMYKYGGDLQTGIEEQRKLYVSELPLPQRRGPERDDRAAPPEAQLPRGLHFSMTADAAQRSPLELEEVALQLALYRSNPQSVDLSHLTRGDIMAALAHQQQSYNTVVQRHVTEAPHRENSRSARVQEAAPSHAGPAGPAAATVQVSKRQRM